MRRGSAHSWRQAQMLKNTCRDISESHLFPRDFIADEAWCPTSSGTRAHFRREFSDNTRLTNTPVGFQLCAWNSLVVWSHNRVASASGSWNQTPTSRPHVKSHAPYSPLFVQGGEERGYSILTKVRGVKRELYRAALNSSPKMNNTVDVN